MLNKPNKKEIYERRVYYCDKIHPEPIMTKYRKGRDEVKLLIERREYV